jgi:RNA polymerase-interacting CarD/CdnL/TRCF family regulator
VKGVSVNENICQYAVGQWVVHSHYGIGKIKEIEQISFTGDMDKPEKCFRVETNNGVFWFPVEQDDNPRLRPISKKTKLELFLKSFQEPPEDTDAHHNVIKARISEAQNDVSLRTSIILVRDLLARTVLKKHNILEDRALQMHKNRIIKEWSLCMELDEAETQARFNALIQNAELQTA